MKDPTQFDLDMASEIASHNQKSQQQPQPVDATTSQEIAARIGELMRAQGIDSEANPLAAEKIQRDLNYQRQLEQLPQPESAPVLAPETTPEIDRLELLQRELEASKAEANKWKKEFGRREGTVGQMKSELAQLKAQVAQIQPAIDVRQITGRDPGEAMTAEDTTRLMYAQSQAFGNALNRLREELLAQATQQTDGLPLELEGELVEAHPWLTDLPRPAKLRAMHDILASSGITVAPPQPSNSPVATPPTLPTQARAPVKQVAYIEPSNKGSAAERNSAVSSERQAFNDKVAKLQELREKPGGASEMEKILSALGAGPVDETQQGFFINRR